MNVSKPTLLLTEAIRARCRENLAAVRWRMAEACRLTGRDPLSVRLVGVTKYVDAPATQMLLDAGCSDLGESRPQLLWQKAEQLTHATPSPRWHLIGHLQRNKLRQTLGLVTLLHSLDSRRLLEAIDAQARQSGRRCEVLVEVNLCGNPARTGLAESEVAPLLDLAQALSHVNVRGLMGMASESDDRQEVGSRDVRGMARQQFSQLRALRDRLAATLPATMPLSELSMGMSNDFEPAILEGSTLVRVGSALWEGIA